MSISNLCYGTNHYHLFRLYDELMTAQQAATAKDLLNEQITVRELKGPHLFSFRKFFNSDGEDFIQWYNDVLAIVSLLDNGVEFARLYLMK